jgi:hypothetical protein
MHSFAAGGRFFGQEPQNHMQMDTYIIDSSRELESILDALAEINVQLRQVIQSSLSVIGKLEAGSRDPNPIEEIELEIRSISILSNMTRTEEAIRSMNQEISVILRNRPDSARVSARFG